MIILFPLSVIAVSVCFQVNNKLGEHFGLTCSDDLQSAVSSNFMAPVVVKKKKKKKKKKISRRIRLSRTKKETGGCFHSNKPSREEKRKEVGSLGKRVSFWVHTHAHTPQTHREARAPLLVLGPSGPFPVTVPGRRKRKTGTNGVPLMSQVSLSVPQQQSL